MRRNIVMRMVWNSAMAVPAVIAHIHDTVIPVEPACPPAPFTKIRAQIYAGSVVHINDTAVRSVINDARIIDRHIDIFHFGRLNGDNRIDNNLDIFVSLQMAVVISLAPHALDRGHDIFLLRIHSFAKLVAPCRILVHHV